MVIERSLAEALVGVERSSVLIVPHILVCTQAHTYICELTADFAELKAFKLAPRAISQLETADNSIKVDVRKIYI